MDNTKWVEDDSLDKCTYDLEMGRVCIIWTSGGYVASWHFWNGGQALQEPIIEFQVTTHVCKPKNPRPEGLQGYSNETRRDALNSLKELIVQIGNAFNKDISAIQDLEY